MQGGRVCVKVIECWCPGEGASPTLAGKDCDCEQGPQAALVEALLARSLAHPHIVSTFTHGVSTEEVRVVRVVGVVRWEASGGRVRGGG